MQDTRQQGIENKTVYTYDNMDRVQTRTDPLLRQEVYSYDVNGNVISLQDRRGKVTTFNYDELDRPAFTGFGTVNGNPTTYESTVTYSYDLANRLLNTADSIGGSITRTYNDQSFRSTETTTLPSGSVLGSITHVLDAGGRPQSMTILGQQPVSYTFDPANRLTQITQGSSSTLLNYDNANRRSTLTLPNGVLLQYSFDTASRLTNMVYSFGSSVLGDLAYSYDAAGRRTQVGGSLARTGLPQPVTSAAYDAANELNQWNGVNLSYDQAGNLLNDGANSYIWDARNQLASVGTMSLQYDALGRRLQNGAGTQFLYDGLNAVQELSGTTPIANRITGGIDKFFAFSDSTGTYVPVTDAQGSVFALANSSGNLTTQYVYDPFGSTSISGAANSNPFQYTGRENDGNGLYYYRARYYSPIFGRFISEDPLHFAGGVNFYAYASDNPINFTDPLGLYSWWDFAGDASDVIAGAGDTLSFGLTAYARNQWGDFFYGNTPRVVNKCSWSYKIGIAGGIVLSTAIGGGAGAEAAEANAGKEGFDFSHWIPDRMGGPRSVFNGNFVSQKLHYLTDYARYPPPAGAALRWGPKLNPVLQQVLRIPWVYDGAAAGAAYGGASAMAGRNCGCY